MVILMNKKGKKIAKKIKNNVLKSKTDTKIAQMKNNINIENVISTKKLKIFRIYNFCTDIINFKIILFTNI